MRRSTLHVVLGCAVLVGAGCDGELSGQVSIAEIQGRDHRSELEGRVVAGVVGVVTVLRDRAGDHGYWMQSSRADDDPATSEGLLVITGELPPAVAPGDLVVVSGRVEEQGRPGQLSVTRLVQYEVEVRERGGPVPDPVLLGRRGRSVPSGHVDDDGLTRFEVGDDAIDFWESVEGMLVAVPDPVVVGPTTGYGQVGVLADGGAGVGGRTRRGGLVKGLDADRPEVILVDLRVAGPPAQLSVGDELDGTLVGVVDYDFSIYLLRAEVAPAVVPSGEPARPVTRLVGTEGALTIATYNVLNLSAVSAPVRFERLAVSIVEQLRSPDVVALQEIQDDTGPEDDGMVTARETLDLLVAAIVDAGGSSYHWTQTDPVDGADGGRPGSNIRVAMLYRPDRVTLVERGEPGEAVEVGRVDGEPIVRPSPGRLGLGVECFRHSRKSQVVELSFAGERLVVVNNHWLSKGGDDPLFGAKQPPDRRTEGERRCQAETVADFARDLLALDPDAALVVLGDLNELEFRSPLEPLAHAGLVNLVERVATSERYTFVYQGRSEVLDHLFVSPSLADGAEIEILHLNADHAARDRTSDHDPIVVRLPMLRSISE